MLPLLYQPTSPQYHSDILSTNSISMSSYLVSYMAIPKAFQHQDYILYLVELLQLIKKKAFCCDGLDFPESWVINIRQYFVHMSIEEEPMWKLDRVLSIILEIGCRLQKGKKNSFRIKKMLFTKKLRYKVLKIKITGEMNKEGIAKKIGSILLYLMKNFRKKDQQMIKAFIFQNLGAVKEPKLQQCFYLSIFLISNSISKTDIKDFCLCQFLVSCLPYHHLSQRAYYLYRNIQLCIKKDKDNCVTFINGKILKYFSKSIFKNEKVVFSIFDHLLEYIPYPNVKDCFHYHLFLVSQQPILALSIKIIKSIIKSSQPSHFYLQILHDRKLTRLLHLQRNPLIQELQKHLLKKLSYINPIIYHQYLNITINEQLKLEYQIQ